MREKTVAAAPGDADDAGSTDAESTVTTDEDLHDECFFDVRAKADEPYKTEQDMGLQECVTLAETYLRTRHCGASIHGADGHMRSFSVVLLSLSRMLVSHRRTYPISEACRWLLVPVAAPFCCT